MQPRQGGSVSIRELLVRGGRVIVLRNARESSEELCTPVSGDVLGSQRLAPIRKTHQQRRNLKGHRHLANGEVERVGLRPPVVQKRAEEGEVVLEARYATLPQNRGALAVPLD
jgi:hypothetical protein